MRDVVSRFRGLLASGSLDLPLPGSGDTSGRHHSLLNFGREDLSLARLVEAHTDAVAILAEANRSAVAEAWYGVWASDSPTGRLEAEAVSNGTWRLSGLKQYCSGAPFVTTALVTAHYHGAVLLFAIELNDAGIRVGTTSWKSLAFADTCTGPVSFDDVRLPSDCLIGGPNWYLERPGFWHGAVGPAACWAGGACSLKDAGGTARKNGSP